MNALQKQSAENEKRLDLSTELATEKVPGMWWNTSTDTFFYEIGWNRYDADWLKGGRRVDVLQNEGCCEC